MGVRHLMARHPHTAARALDRAANYIDDGWTQGHYALKDDGAICAPTDPGAACFCVSGAMMRAIADFVGPRAEATAAGRRIMNRMMDAVGVEVGTDRLNRWNDADGQTGAAVARALERAAVRVRAVERRHFPEPVPHITDEPHCHACVDYLDRSFTCHVPRDQDAWWCIECGCPLTPAADALVTSGERHESEGW